MKRSITILLSIAALVFFLIAAAGIYKFNYLAGKPGYDVDGNPIVIERRAQAPVIYQSETGEIIETYALGLEAMEINFIQHEDVYLKAVIGYRVNAVSGVQYISKDERFTFWSKGNEASIFGQDNNLIFNGVLQTDHPNNDQAIETIYFDPAEKVWKDHLGICHSCTPEKGFTTDGQITDAPTQVVWHELFFKLKNDLNENPPLAEVKEIFADQYGADSGWFGTYVSQNGDVFRIIVATEQRDIDFVDRKGALKATYEITEIR